MTVLMLSQTILGYLRSTMLIKLQSKIDTNLMVTFFDHLLSLPLRYFQLRSSGDILSRLASNSIIRDTVNSQFISSILDTTSVFVYLAILIKLSPIFAVLALCFGFAQILLMVSTNHHILTLLKRSLEAQAKSQGYLTEAMVEVTTLKAAGAEKHVRSRWLRLFFAEMSTVVKRNYFFAFVSSMQSIIQGVPILRMLRACGAHKVFLCGFCGQGPQNPHKNTGMGWRSQLPCSDQGEWERPEASFNDSDLWSFCSLVHSK